jgi:hypothetical protein
MFAVTACASGSAITIAAVRYLRPRQACPTGGLCAERNKADQRHKQDNKGIHHRNPPSLLTNIACRGRDAALDDFLSSGCHRADQ